MTGLNGDQAAEARAQYAEGWHFDFRGQPVGPVSFQELTRRYAAGELMPSDLVWHPKPARWLAMRDVARVLGLHESHNASGADPEIMRRLAASGGSPVRNPVHLAATTLAAFVSLLIVAQTITASDGETLGLLFLLLTLGLAWWAWLEFRGVRLIGRSISFPLRLPYLPGNAAYWSTHVDLSQIDSATFQSTGDTSHYIILDVNGNGKRLYFETALLRDTMLTLLSFAQIRIVKP